jgi:hypothetical protein
MFKQILEIAGGIQLAKWFDTPMQDTQMRNQQIQDREENARSEAIFNAGIQAERQRQKAIADFFRMLKNNSASLDQLKTGIMQGYVVTPSDMSAVKYLAKQVDDMKTTIQDMAAPSDMQALENFAAELDELTRLACVQRALSPLPAKPRYRQPNALDRFFGEKAPDEE